MVGSTGAAPPKPTAPWMASKGHTWVQSPQPSHKPVSTKAWPRVPDFGPRSPSSKPMPGHPMEVMHFLQPVHVSASIVTGASGFFSWMHGARKMIADGPSKSMAARAAATELSRLCGFANPMCWTPRPCSTSSITMGRRRSPMSVTPVPGCGWLPVMAVVALSRMAKATS